LTLNFLGYSLALLLSEVDIGAKMLIPPSAEVIQKVVKLPVYDVYTMGMWFDSGLISRNQWKHIE
jgi:hypothetical protein